MVQDHRDSKPTPPRAPGSLQMVAVDIDGTLLRSDKSLTPETVEVIRRVNERGVHVVLASARPPRSLHAIHRALKLTTPQINYNGALIHDRLLNRNLFHQPLASSLAKRIIKTARRNDPKVIVSLEILDKWYTDHFDNDLAWQLPTETSLNFQPDFVGPLESFLHVPITKVMLLAPPPRLEKILDVIVKRFGDQAAILVGEPHLIQIIHRKVDKFTALQQIAEQYGVDRQHVMAIGDAPNDVGMLRWAGLGIAMANAHQVVLDAADAVAPSNDHDGVADVLNRYILDR